MPESPEADDPVDSSLWRPVWRLLAALDDDIAAVYDEHGLTEVRPRFVGPLIRLARHGSMSIQQLAERSFVTHSAMSQTVTAMRRAGLVDSDVGSDTRTRLIALTDRSRALIPFLEAEWRATEASLRELEDEVPYGLRRAAGDIAEALDRRSFPERLRTHLAEFLPNSGEGDGRE